MVTKAIAALLKKGSKKVKDARSKVDEAFTPKQLKEKEAKLKRTQREKTEKIKKETKSDDPVVRAGSETKAERNRRLAKNKREREKLKKEQTGASRRRQVGTAIGATALGSGLTAGVLKGVQDKKAKEKKAADKKKADERGITQEEIIKEWKYKADFSCEKGSAFHEYVENFLTNKVFPFPEHKITKALDGEENMIECKKAVMNSINKKTNRSTTSTIYYTNKIDNSYNINFKKLKGFPIYYEIISDNIISTYLAVEIINKNINPKIFEIDNNTSIYKMEEFKALMTQ